MANKLFYSKALHNILLLQKYNKNDYAINNMYKLLITHINNKSHLDNKSHLVLYDINKTIDKIYISHAIQESLIILNKTKSIDNYQEQFTDYYYQDSIDNLYLLFNQLHNEIAELYTTRNKYIILPFYMNIFLKKK